MKKIAVPVTENKQIDEHFGHCSFYSIFTISDENKIVDTKTIPAEQGCGCKSNIAFTLAAEGVSTMLAGGIGGGAINVLAQVGITVVRGCTGNAADAVQLFVEGKLSDSGESCSQHENHHGQGHGGGGHSCNH